MPTRNFWPGAISAGILLSSALVLSGCGQSHADAPPSAPPPPEVSVVTLKPQRVTLTRELPGRASALLVAEVRPQVSGIVQRRLFTEGSLVKAGQPLYQLEDSSYRADQASAKAALERARANLRAATQTAERAAGLVKIDAISKQDHENATNALALAKADVAAAEAALQRSSVVLGYANITSPISGRIGRSNVTQGALVTANQAGALATVQQLDPLYIDLNQSSSELLQLRKEVSAGRLNKTQDLPVKILLEDGTAYAHDGKLAFSDVTVDQSTGSFLLRVKVPNPDNLLLPGMYVRAQVGSGFRDNALLVPQRGVTRDPRGNASAMVVTQDGKVEVRQLQASRTIGDKWLVDGGLAAGERVIVEGLQKVRPGAPAVAVEAGPDGAPKQVAAAGAASK